MNLRRPSAPRTRAVDAEAGSADPDPGTASTPRLPGRSRARRSRSWSRPTSRRDGGHSRPEGRVRAAGWGRSQPGRAQKPPPTITVRTLALGLVVLVAFIVMAPTLRAFVTQREQYRRLEADIASTQASVDSLEAELRRWSDAGYVQAQARARLSFVRPGEVAYRVIDPETVLADGAEQAGLRSLTASVDTAPAVPWYLTFWDSVVEAGEPVAREDLTFGQPGAPEDAGGQGADR